MSKLIILQDKIFNIGKFPIYNSSYETIGHIHNKISIRGKSEVYKGDVLASVGKAKLISLFPTWTIDSSDGNRIGTIKRKWTFWLKKYRYMRIDGATFHISGNILDRKFKVFDENGIQVLNVTTLSSLISLRPQTFAIEFLTQDLETWEAITLIQGIRTLVKKENQSNQDH